MTNLNYRMIQRRGSQSDLPNKPLDGEIYIATDTNSMYFGSGGKKNKVLTIDDVTNGIVGSNTVVNNTLTSTSTTEALSANMGKELKDDILDHTQNNIIHVTSAEKNQWNAKAPSTIVSTTANGLMTSSDKIKLNSIAVGANNTVINDTLTSTSATEALSANQGRILKDMINSGIGGNTVAIVDNLTSTSTSSALSANQGKIVNDKITTHTGDATAHITSTERTTWNNKANNTVATTSTNGLMSSTDKTKLNGIAVGATNTTIVDNLTSTSNTSALSANQGKILNDKISAISGGSNVNVINNLTSTSTTDALSANQGKTLNESKLSISGGTLQGQLVAQSNTAYTSRQVRNITYSTSTPTNADGQNGDMWVVYE